MDIRGIHSDNTVIVRKPCDVAIPWEGRLRSKIPNEIAAPAWALTRNDKKAALAGGFIAIKLPCSWWQSP